MLFLEGNTRPQFVPIPNTVEPTSQRTSSLRVYYTVPSVSYMMTRPELLARLGALEEHQAGLLREVEEYEHARNTTLAEARDNQLKIDEANAILLGVHYPV